MADIVTISEFSVLNRKTGKGSRGSTFKKYVTDYMSRENAVENLGPVGLVSNPDEYINWMDTLHEDAKIVEGAAFDDNHLALTASEIEQTAENIQYHFRHGKTIFKTVISFDPEYLKKLQVCSPDLQIAQKGDYFGKADMLKLRMAIQNGMEQFSCGFDQLKWIGVIQADTLHIHCHLCMVDEGHGVLHHSGQQRGKAPEVFFDRLKTGIAQELERTALLMTWYRDLQAIPGMSRDKENTIHPETEWMAKVLRLLPENTELWTAPTNDPRMRPASDLFEQGLKQALNNRNGLNSTAKSSETLRFEIMNETYKTIAAIFPAQNPKQTRRHLPGIEFDIRQPESETEDSLSLQMRRHRRRQIRKKRHEQKVLACQKRMDDLKASTVPGSAILMRYYQTERDYHMQVFRKYDALCGFEIPADLSEQAREVDLLKEQQINLKNLQQDTNFLRLAPEESDEYVLKKYGLSHGNLYRRHPEKLIEDTESVTTHLQTKESIFQCRIVIRNLVRTEDGQLVKKAPSGSLKDLVLIDAHEMGEDEKSEKMTQWPNAWKTFRNWAQKRYEAFRNAWPYFQKIHQQDEEIATRQEIEQMVDTAKQEFRTGYKNRMAERARFQHLNMQQIITLQKQLTEQMEAWVPDWMPHEQVVVPAFVESDRSEKQLGSSMKEPAKQNTASNADEKQPSSSVPPQEVRKTFAGFDNVTTQRSETQEERQR